MATACTDFEQDLVLYHYGELSAEERDQIAIHLRRCSGCATYVKELATLLPLTITADEPAEEFWQNYSREMRHKLADLQEQSWWQALPTWLRSWTVPALTGTAVIALALTLNIGEKTTTTNDVPAAEQALIEVMPMAENLELINNMDVLENIEVLELMGASGNEAV